MNFYRTNCPTFASTPLDKSKFNKVLFKTNFFLGKPCPLWEIFSSDGTSKKNLLKMDKTSGKLLTILHWHLLQTPHILIPLFPHSRHLYLLAVWSPQLEALV